MTKAAFRFLGFGGRIVVLYGVHINTIGLSGTGDEWDRE